MNKLALEAFATKLKAKSRITFGDVCRMRRDVLPDGVTSREEAELLIRLDRQVTRVDGAWIEWLTSAIVEFAVWSERPTGRVEGEAARWLAKELLREGPLSKAGRRIAREVQIEAEDVSEPLASLGLEPAVHVEERNRRELSQ